MKPDLAFLNRIDHSFIVLLPNLCNYNNVRILGLGIRHTWAGIPALSVTCCETAAKYLLLLFLRTGIVQLW